MTEDNPLSVFESAAVVSIRPADVVLFRCQQKLTKVQRAEAVEMLNEVFPDHESVILENGADIAVLRPEPGLVGRVMRRLFGARNG